MAWLLSLCFGLYACCCFPKLAERKLSTADLHCTSLSLVHILEPDGKTCKSNIALFVVITAICRIGLFISISSLHSLALMVRLVKQA